MKLDCRGLVGILAITAVFALALTLASVRIFTRSALR
jgi:hypothetical protein